MCDRSGRYRKYTAQRLAHRIEQWPRSEDERACVMAVGQGARPLKRTASMLDIVYLLIGAVFLGACVLYTYACDHL